MGFRYRHLALRYRMNRSLLNSRSDLNLCLPLRQHFAATLLSHTRSSLTNSRAPILKVPAGTCAPLQPAAAT